MGWGCARVSAEHAFLVTLHTNPFQVPMYILCWCGGGCIAKLSHLKQVVFRVITFCACSAGGPLAGW